MQARYVQRSESIDIVPGKDVAAGEIVFFGDLVGVAKSRSKLANWAASPLAAYSMFLNPSDVRSVPAPWSIGTRCGSPQ